MTTDEQNARFGDWLGLHAAMLHHVANGFADGADRQDLMQELMLAVWRAVPAFRGGAQASTFIYRVAHNAALTWRRTQKNYRSRVDRFETMIAIEAPVAPATADAREREALEHIYAAIRRLPPLDRSLILLHLDGVAYTEIAAIHGLTETNVGVRLNRLLVRVSCLTRSDPGVDGDFRAPFAISANRTRPEVAFHLGKSLEGGPPRPPRIRIFLNLEFWRLGFCKSG